MQLQRLFVALPCAALLFALAACATESKPAQGEQTASNERRVPPADCPTGTQICRRSSATDNVRTVSGESVQNSPTTFRGAPAK